MGLASLTGEKLVPVVAVRLSAKLRQSSRRFDTPFDLRRGNRKGLEIKLLIGRVPFV